MHAEVVKLCLGREDVSPDIPDLKGKTSLELRWTYHTKVVELFSTPKPSLPLLADIDEVPEHPLSPNPSDLSQTSPLPRLAPSSYPPVLRGAIGFFMIISSLIFLFYFLAVVSPSFLIILLLSFRV